jgi:hypothetical protein
MVMKDFLSDSLEKSQEKKKKKKQLAKVRFTPHCTARRENNLRG